ncbi:MAG: hypothetical protein LBH36_00480 [Candidatus Nomurabacteria bacterium]|jgi:predicted translin family RNA/ssDNA-binding protein|nr:hypothetical protein [Candidatus Nomurabacteria bacterium]
MDTNPSQGQPQPVVPPIKGVQPDAGQAVVPPSNIKLKPGVIIAIAGGVVGLAAILLVLFLVVIPILSVSKDDYDDAYELARDVTSECSTVGSVYGYTNGSTSVIKNKLADMKEALKECDETVKKLSDAKAVKLDSKAKELYEAFSKKYDDYKKATYIATEAIESIHLPIAEVTKGGSSAEQMQKYASDLSAKLSKVGNLKYDENKTLLSDIKKAVSSLETALAKYKATYDAYKNDWRNNDYPSLTDSGYYNAQDDLSAATKKWSDKVSDLGESSEPSKPLGKLCDYLIEKS